MTHDEQKTDLEKLNHEIEEELLQYLDGDKSFKKEENHQLTFNVVFQYVMTVILILIVITNVLIIVYKLL